MHPQLVVCPPDQAEQVAALLTDVDSTAIWPGAWVVKGVPSKDMSALFEHSAPYARIIATALRTDETVLISGISQPETDALGTGMVADILGAARP